MAKLSASRRDQTGSRAARRLRRDGLIPGIIYGHGEDTESVTLSEHDLEVALLHGEKVLEVDVDGKVQNVLVKDVQWDVFGHEVLHVDLTRVNLDERVNVTIPILLRGTAPGTREGGMLTQVLNEVNVECAVKSIPEEIRISVNELNVGDRLLLSDLELPPDTVLLDEPDAMCCQVTRMAEEEEEVPAEEPGAAEPEVIGEKKEDDEAAAE